MGESLPQDKIELRGMAFYGFHGVSPAEKELGQRFVVDVDIFRDLTKAGRTDDLGDTVNYSEVYRTVRDIVEGPSLNLLESVAAAIAEGVLGSHDAGAVRVRVRKPEVPMKGSILTHAAVEIYREVGGPLS